MKVAGGEPAAPLLVYAEDADALGPKVDDELALVADDRRGARSAPAHDHPQGFPDDQVLGAAGEAVVASLHHDHDHAPEL